MHPITLTAEPGTWQRFSARRIDKAFEPTAKKVLQRDGYACQFCSFQAREYQEVLNVDGDYDNNKLDNMATACVFCTQCFFLDAVGVHFGGGTLIFMPELGQGDVNSLCHVLFCAMANGTAYRNSAQSVYRSLKFRSQPMESCFGEGLSVPGVFGQLMIEYQANGKTMDREKMEGMRLLPSRARFKTQIERWAQLAAEELSQGS